MVSNSVNVETRFDRPDRREIDKAPQRPRRTKVQRRESTVTRHSFGVQRVPRPKTTILERLLHGRGHRFDDTPNPAFIPRSIQQWLVSSHVESIV
jgi:hypothetical protein